MMIIRISAVVLITLCSAIILKQSSTKLAYIIPVAAFITIATVLISRFAGSFKDILDEYNAHNLSEYMLILSKALGISFICAITSEICVNCGENMLSSICTLAGKLEILILCVPLITSLLEIAGTIT